MSYFAVITVHELVTFRLISSETKCMKMVDLFKSGSENMITIQYCIACPYNPKP